MNQRTIGGSPRLLVVSRHDLAAPRPQPFQVLCAAVGAAAAGAQVTLLMDDTGPPRDPQGLEDWLGTSLAGLDVRCATGTHPGLRGLRRRWLLSQLLRRRWDWILTRDFRIARQLGSLLRWARVRPRIALEWHAVPSALGQRSERERAAASAADAFVFISEGLQQFVQRSMGVKRPGLVLPNGCQLRTVQADRGLEQLATARRVMASGLFRQPSDRSVLGEVVRGLPPGLELEIVGPSDARTRREAQENHGVTVTGWLGPAEAAARLPGCLCQLALYVEDLNTRSFASPLKVIQALASGVPLVATDLPTTRSIIQHGVNGLLVPPGDTSATLAAVAALAADRAMARRLAGAALQQAQAWTWKRRGQRLLNFLEVE